MKNLLSIAIILCLFISCTKQQSDEKTTDDIAIITTEFGEIHVVLYDETPQHKENFFKVS